MKIQSSVSVKLAKKEDVNLVSQIVASSFKDCQERFKPIADNIPSWIEWWNSLAVPKFDAHEKFIESNLTYQILKENIVIGTFRLECYNNKSELDDFCILPEHQNKGYGKDTLTLIETLCNSDLIYLSTPYFCVSNRYLYEKAGYKQIGTRSDDTVICFEKNLK